jgi:hypothetical protein
MAATSNKPPDIGLRRTARQDRDRPGAVGSPARPVDWALPSPTSAFLAMPKTYACPCRPVNPLLHGKACRCASRTPPFGSSPQPQPICQPLCTDSAPSDPSPRTTRENLGGTGCPRAAETPGITAPEPAPPRSK